MREGGPSVSVGNELAGRRALSWAYAVLIAALLSLAPAAHATDDNPLRPPDTSSPRATMQGLIE